MSLALAIGVALGTVITVEIPATAPDRQETALRQAVRRAIAQRKVAGDRETQVAVSAEVVAHAGRFARLEEITKSTIRVLIDDAALEAVLSAIRARLHPRVEVRGRVDGAPAPAIAETVAAGGVAIAGDAPPDRVLEVDVVIERVGEPLPMGGAALRAAVTAELAHPDGRLVRRQTFEVTAGGPDAAAVRARLLRRVGEALVGWFGGPASDGGPPAIAVFFAAPGTTAGLRAALTLAGASFNGVELAAGGASVPLGDVPSARWVERLDGAADEHVRLRARLADEGVRVTIETTPAGGAGRAPRTGR